MVGFVHEHIVSEPMMLFSITDDFTFFVHNKYIISRNKTTFTYI